MYKELYIDQDILLKLSANDSATIEQLYTQHYKTISSWIMKLGGSEEDAADICQESMIVLYEKSKDESFRLSCKITTYLFAIAKHLWYKKAKSNLSNISLDDEQESNLEENYQSDINAHKEREAHYEQLEAALNMLGEPCSKLLKSYYYNNKSMQEIARDFEYTNADNAKTQKYKCLSRLKKIFYNNMSID